MIINKFVWFFFSFFYFQIRKVFAFRFQEWFELVLVLFVLFPWRFCLRLNIMDYLSSRFRTKLSCMLLYISANNSLTVHCRAKRTKFLPPFTKPQSQSHQSYKQVNLAKMLSYYMRIYYVTVGIFRMIIQIM